MAGHTGRPEGGHCLGRMAAGGEEERKKGVGVTSRPALQAWVYDTLPTPGSSTQCHKQLGGFQQAAGRLLPLPPSPGSPGWGPGVGVGAGVSPWAGGGGAVGAESSQLHSS